MPYCIVRRVQRLATFRNSMISSFCLALSVAILVPSYYQLFASEVVVFETNDGWCNPDFQGVGIHCFGDFYYHLNFLGIDYPYASGNAASPYPPLGLFFFKPFELLVTAFPNSNFGLIFYFLFLLSALLIPILFLQRKLSLLPSETAIVCFMTFSMSPILIGIDRGNNVILLMPLFFFFCNSIINGRFTSAVVFAIIMSTIKPQMLISILVFFALRKFRLTLITLVTTCSIHLLGFLSLGGGLERNLKEYWITFSYQQSYWKPGSIHPPNISISNFIAVAQRILFGRDFEAQYLPPWVIGVFLACILLVLHLNGQKMSKLKLLMIVGLIPTLVPNTGGPYYLSTVCAVFVLLLASSFGIENETEQLKHSTSLKREIQSFVGENHFPILILFAVVVLVPWAFPLRALGIQYISAFTSVQWILAGPTLLLFFSAMLWIPIQESLGDISGWAHKKLRSK